MIYLDNAATTHKKPDSVTKRLYDLSRLHSANAGRGGHKYSLDASEIIYEAQETCGKLFGIDDPTRIAFTQNTTQALNFAIHGCLKEGDHAIITSMEHNSVRRPVFYSGCRFDIARGDAFGYVEAKKIEELIEPGTKMIIVNHVSNVCGTRQNIEKIAEIAKKHNIIFLLDSAQSAGVYDIDCGKIGIDMLAFAGHKGIMGPLGTGGLYVKNGININPIMQGGSGSNSEDIHHPDSMPDILVSGTQNMPAIGALGEAANFILKNGTENIRKHEEKLAREFRRALSDNTLVNLYGREAENGVVSLNIENMDSIEVSQILNDKYKIAVRGGLHCAPLAHETLGTNGTVRFSFGFYNTMREAEYAADAIKKICKNRIN